MEHVAQIISCSVTTVHTLREERFMVKTKKKKRAADMEAIKKLMEEAGITTYKVETDLNIPKSTLLRGLKPNPERPLPVHWELPILKYLRKKILEEKEGEIQTTEVLQELGFKTPEQESNLKEELKENKRTWVDNLQG